MVVVGIVVVAVALAVYVGMRIERRRHTPPELKGDWWAEFEGQFRAYARRLEQSRRPRHRNDHGQIGQ